MTTISNAYEADTTTRRSALERLLPALLLALVLGGVWLVLLARGLDLGYTGDLLDYAYHYERLGTFGGARWLVTEHLQRHLLAPLFSAPLAYLFPDSSAAWYAYAFGIHYLNAIMVYVLANAVLHGQSRWLSFLAGLVFAFHTLHTGLNFEFPTSGHGNTALLLALVSLWFYIRFVRCARCSRVWLELSWAAFAVAIAIYEQTALFFLLHPLIAFFEDRLHVKRHTFPRWMLRVALDSIPFPLFVIAYLLLLRILFAADDHLVLAPSHLMSQLVGGLAVELSPGALVARLAPAFRGNWLLFTVVIAGALWTVIALWNRRSASAPVSGSSSHRDHISYLAALGAGVMVVSILGVAPTQWVIAEHPRVIYPSSVGFAFLLIGVVGWLTTHVRLAGVAFAAVVALLIGAGVSRLFLLQDEFAAQEAARREALIAIRDAVPGLEDDAYLLLVSDANPTTDMWLFAQDNRFPLMFDRLFGAHGLLADALYFDLEESLAPPDDLPGREYNGQFIVVEEEGIYSPLRPYEPIDPARLVIVYYDSVTGDAEIMDELPTDVIERANVVQRADIEWRTNPAMILDETAR